MIIIPARDWYAIYRNPQTQELFPRPLVAWRFDSGEDDGPVGFSNNDSFLLADIDEWFLTMMYHPGGEPTARDIADHLAREERQ